MNFHDQDELKLRMIYDVTLSIIYMGTEREKLKPDRAEKDKDWID